MGRFWRRDGGNLSTSSKFKLLFRFLDFGYLIYLIFKGIQILDLWIFLLFLLNFWILNHKFFPPSHIFSSLLNPQSTVLPSSGISSLIRHTSPTLYKPKKGPTAVSRPRPLLQWNKRLYLIPNNAELLTIDNVVTCNMHCAFQLKHIAYIGIGHSLCHWRVIQFILVLLYEWLLYTIHPWKN